MKLTGEKVVIRDAEPTDHIVEAIWELDYEVRTLDPSVGKILNYRQFSIDALDGVHIGICSLYNQTEADIQLGIRIGNKDYWSKGCGTDTVRLLLQHAFETMSVDRVWLKVLPWNIQAIRCYEKSGFIRYGRLSLDGYEFVVMEAKR